MRTKRLVLVCILLGLLAGTLALWLTSPRHHITPERFDSIELGMTQQEVETLLGGPAGNYSRGAVTWSESSKTMELHLCGVVRVQTWVGNDAAIEVGFDRQGAVVWKDRLPVRHLDRTFGDTLRRWLGHCCPYPVHDWDDELDASPQPF